MNFKKKPKNHPTILPSNYPTIQLSPARGWSAFGGNWRRRRPALSMVELLVGMAILGLISLMVAAVYFANFRLFTNQNASINVSNQNKLAIDEMVNQIREAAAMNYTCCSSPTENAGDTELILQLWPLNSTLEPCEPGTSGCAATGNYDYIVYKCATNCALGNTVVTNLIKRTAATAGSFRPANSGDIIISNLKDVKFTYIDSGGSEGVACNSAACLSYPRVKVTLTTEAKTFVQKQQTQTITHEAMVVLRNK